MSLGNAASGILYEAARETWKNRDGRIGEVIELFEGFSGTRAIDVSGLPAGSYINIGFDGVGTKVELAERTARHDTVAYDLFAMVCDDAVVRGAEPVLLGSVLDVNSLGRNPESSTETLRQLARGYVGAAEEARVAVVNGEIAELGYRVNGHGGFNYNWSAGILWFVRKDRMLTGHGISEGQAIVGMREHGFGSNGLSLARLVLEAEYGEEWHGFEFHGSSLGTHALLPSRIYTPAIVDMIGGFDREPMAEVSGVAHITGGGLPEKLRRVLKPSGLGANLHSLFNPSELMLHCQSIGNVSDREAYSTWNMGQRMLVITSDPDTVIRIGQQHGKESKVVGEVTRDPSIVITSKGAIEEGRTLVFEA